MEKTSHMDGGTGSFASVIVVDRDTELSSNEINLQNDRLVQKSKS